MFPQGGHADEIYGHGPAGTGPVLPAHFGQVVLLPTARRPSRAPELELHITPIHHLHSFALCAADVTLSPAGPPAEMRRLIGAACRQAASWQTGAPGPALRAVLHVQPHPARGAALADQTSRLLRDMALAPHLLELAFSEADPALDSRDMPLLVSALRDLGVRVAIDRVRRAQDCLHRLRRLPATTLRLHPVLVRDLEDNAEARAEAMEAICTAHALGAIVVALGVQSPLQRDILADMQCDEAQGPLFSDPVPSEAFRRALLDPDLTH